MFLVQTMRVAWRGMMANQLRTMLTMLGIVVGVGSVGTRCVVVLMRGLDTFWLIVPSLGAAGVGAVWPHLTALLGIGGLWTAFFVWNLARAPLLPAGLPAPMQDNTVASEPHHNRIVRHER